MSNKERERETTFRVRDLLDKHVDAGRLQEKMQFIHGRVTTKWR